MKPRTEQLNWQTFRVWYTSWQRNGVGDVPMSWLDVSATDPSGARERVFAKIGSDVRVYDVEPIQV